MSSEENKGIVRHYLTELWSKHNLAVVDQYIAADYLPHSGGMPGRDGIRALFNALSGGFPDIEFIIEDMIAEEEKVVWRSTIRGTHTGVFRNIPPTGKPVAITSINIVRVVDGMITESWNQLDTFGMMQQLGVIP